MDDLTRRLISCFRAVFPDATDTEILSASQATLKTWDSIAAISLLNVIEEEFSIQMDLDMLAEFDSFEHILAFLRSKVS